MGDQVRDITTNIRTDGSTGIPDPLFAPPGTSGTGNGYPVGGQTTYPTWWFNMIQEEQKHQIEALGITPVANDVHQLAQGFEQGSWPAPADLVLIDQVVVGDMDLQQGSHMRVGRMVGIFGALSWTNANAGLDAVVVNIHLPWIAATPPSDVIGTGRVSPTQSEFQGDNALGPFFDVVPDGNGVFLTIGGNNGPGTAVVPVKIGDGDTEGIRRTQFVIWYETTGVPVPAWPRAEWDLRGDQPVGAALDLTYFGAQAGDFISIRDQADVEVQSLAVGAVPTDTITAGAILTVGQYTIDHRGSRSRPITVGQQI